MLVCTLAKCYTTALSVSARALLNHPAFEISLPFLKRSYTVISVLQIQSRERASADVEMEVKGGFLLVSGGDRRM